MSGGFPVELILVGMVALFLVLRLRSVLGRRTGFERPPQAEPRPGALDPRSPSRQAEPPAADGLPPPAQASTSRILPDPRSPPGQALGRIVQVDRSFESNAFLDGAQAAFGMILTAFAAGDRQTLRALLSDDTYAGFEQAITAREQAGERQRSELRGFTEVTLEGADLRGSIADVTVRFVTDQVNMVTDRAGAPVSGSDGITELTDVWTFQRDLSSPDPTWRLVATRSV